MTDYENDWERFKLAISGFSALHSNHSDKCDCEPMDADSGRDNDCSILFSAYGLYKYWAQFEKN